MRISTRVKFAAVLAAAGVSTVLPSARGAFVTWQSRAHTGDITADTPSHPHTAAGYVAAWNAIAGNAPTAGNGNGGFDDWTNKNNQTAVTGGTNSNFGVHAFFSFFVPANDQGTWTFSLGGDGDFGGTVLLDGTELATSSGGFFPTGPSGSRSLTTGIHTLDYYAFEGCCDGAGTSTFQDPLSATPRTINNTNLQATPEPMSASLLGVAAGGLLLQRRRRRV